MQKMTQKTKSIHLDVICTQKKKKERHLKKEEESTNFHFFKLCSHSEHRIFILNWTSCVKKTHCGILKSKNMKTKEKIF